MPGAYRKWRGQLTEIQQRFDAFEENWPWGEKTYEEYKLARQPLVDELEAHYQKEGDAVAEDGA